MSWSEGRIKKMLSAKHAADIFVAGCKDGPTVGGLRVLDGWAMPRSWAHPHCVGYEIKVSRSDWLGDKKWPTYLPLCHQLYIVCPYKLLKKDEIPDPLGLMWAQDGETGRIITAKKAAIRNVAIPENLFRYVLMYRAKVVAQYEPVAPDREAWLAWLEEKNELRSLGPLVSKKILELQEREDHKLKADTLVKGYEALQKKHEALLNVLRASGIWLHSLDDLEIRELRERLASKSQPVAVKKQAEQLKLIGKSISRVEQELRELCAKEAE